jgi:hypothetical protein
LSPENTLGVRIAPHAHGEKKLKPFLVVAALTLAFADIPRAAAGPYLPDPDEVGARVKIEDRAWALGGFDNVLFVKLKLKNTAPFAVKDFVIGCIVVAESGTVIGTPKTTLYQTLRPGQSKIFPGISLGLVNSQTKRVGCEVLSASRHE